MELKRLIRWNLILIAIIGLYGFVTDEPYWRDNGHGPWLYDYLFWFALALNGPSGFLADYLSWHLHVHVDWRFLIQYALWGLLIWPQWRFYHWLIHLHLGNIRNKILFYGFASLIIVSGTMASYKAWLFGHRPSDFFIDKYFWFVRIAGLTCSGILILVYRYMPSLGWSERHETKR